jgi:uncharacterized membrane protein
VSSAGAAGGPVGGAAMMPRTPLIRGVWILLWASWIGLCAQQVANVARFGAPWPMWLLWLLPLVLFMPGVARDNLRAVIWLCFVTLFYFVIAVEWVFAQPTAWVPVSGLVLVVLLFSASVAYIRLRGRQLRGVTSEVSQGGEQDG